MLEINAKPSRNKKLIKKYLQENKVMSVRGGSDYKLSPEAKEILKGAKSRRRFGFLRKLF